MERGAAPCSKSLHFLGARPTSRPLSDSSAPCRQLGPVCVQPCIPHAPLCTTPCALCGGLCNHYVLTVPPLVLATWLARAHCDLAQHPVLLTPYGHHGEDDTM